MDSRYPPGKRYWMAKKRLGRHLLGEWSLQMETCISCVRCRGLRPQLSRSYHLFRTCIWQTPSFRYWNLFQRPRYLCFLQLVLSWGRNRWYHMVWKRSHFESMSSYWGLLRHSGSTLHQRVGSSSKLGIWWSQSLWVEQVQEHYRFGIRGWNSQNHLWNLFR